MIGGLYHSFEVRKDKKVSFFKLNYVQNIVLVNKVRTEIPSISRFLIGLEEERENVSLIAFWLVLSGNQFKVTVRAFTRD